jgi:hypothetical protein
VRSGSDEGRYSWSAVDLTNDANQFLSIVDGSLPDSRLSADRSVAYSALNTRRSRVVPSTGLEKRPIEQSSNRNALDSNPRTNVNATTYKAADGI